MLANDADPNSVQSLLVRNNHRPRDKDAGLELAPLTSAHLPSAPRDQFGPGIFGERCAVCIAEAGARTATFAAAQLRAESHNATCVRDSSTKTGAVDKNEVGRRVKI
jgi:hypothetical protein